MKTRAVVLLCLAGVLCGGAQEIGYVETFSLADDREAALRELVPGTDDYYYFHALHAQNTGMRQRFQEVMDRWQRDRDGHVTDSARELLNRQALLDYARQPQETLDYLKRELGLTFPHARKTGKRLSRAPSAFDNAAISPDALLAHALSDPRSLSFLSDDGLAFVAKARLTDEQRRSLLSRLRRPDYPGLVELIVADLNYRDSRGFGHHPIHGRLTLDQMDGLLKRMPGLRNERLFVNAYLAKLAPENEVDLDTDSGAREAYYERVWSFAKTLDPVHNSLKANVLYNRLRHDLSKGRYDRERFLEYVKLPRHVDYLRAEYREKVPHGNQFAQLNQDFNLITMLPVPQEEPLVRQFLLEFFKADADYDMFAPYIRDDFLKPLFAEAKIVNGVGGPQQWVPLLTPDLYKRLKERVDIDFSESNPAVVGTEAVKLTAHIKNVPSLWVKVYEINTFNYYRETGQPLNLAVNLDGLVASVSRRCEYAEPSERRVTRTFDFPEIKDRGVYVVELIGNGKSSRALVQKGRLDVLQEVTSAGHAFTVLDEDGRRLVDASAWLGGREFTADKDGRILVPFSTAPKSERLVIRHGGFASLVTFDHLAEVYTLNAGFYVDRESLLRREKAQLAARPVLRVNGRPTSLKLLEAVRLAVRSTDLQGIVTEKEFPGLALREDAETVQEILVPESAVSLTFTLKAEIQNISLNRKTELGDSATFALNEMERTSRTRSLHVGKTASGYYADLRGKNGEPLAGEPLHCAFLHRYFLDGQRGGYIHAELTTDAQGRASLGALDGISVLKLGAADCATREWRPQRDTCAYPAALHGVAGGTLRVPFMREVADASDAASLLEMRLGQFVKDWTAALAVKDGFVELRGLPAGDYSLLLKDEGREIAVCVTQGAERDGFVVSPRLALELPRLAPLAVTAVVPGRESVEIRLANVTPFARVHLFATRYLAAYDVFGRLGFSGAPGLVRQQRQPVRTFYESGRDIGDEYRYIIDRQQAQKYPGNMLERPGLLLNPWARRTTEAEAERLAEGREYAGRAAGEAKAAGGVAGARLDAAGGNAEGLVSLDFLKQPAVTLLNLVPDKEGKVIVPRGALKGLPYLRVLAVDPSAAVLKCAALEDSPVETRELRLVEGLAPDKAYAEQKLVTPVQAKAIVTVGDVTTSRFETYDTVAKVYRLLATLNPDATFGEFAFVANWPAADAAEQRRLYSKYACHELNFFLYHKDPKFFENVIAPCLRNKKDKTFMDHWLLGDDLGRYLEPWRFARLNAAERVLLGKRLRAQEPSLARDTRERADLLPPDMEAFNRRFDTAVQTGSLEADTGGAAGAIDAARARRSEEAKKELSVLAQAPNAPLPAAAPAPVMLEADQAVAASVLKKNVLGATLQRAVHLKAKRDGRSPVAETIEAEADAPAEKQFFKARDADRKAARRFFQKLDKTQEWAENNYWHLPIERQVAELVKVNAFWADYATHDGKTPFLSKALAEATANFTEMMLALAVLNVPFEASPHAEKVEGLSYTLQAGSPLVCFHREIREAARAEAAGGMLVAQHFFRADDRERFENNERYDKRVTDEFLPQVVYGAQVVLTNPTGNRQKLNALLQIPRGAIPVSNGFYTRGVYIVLEPYSTQTREYFFYFPTTGRYPHYPVTLASQDRVVGSAAPFTFNVVANLSKTDTASWAWLSQNGTEDEVVAFLNAANIHRINLDEIAWRMKEKTFFLSVTQLLEKRHIYSDVLWSYGLLHNVPPAIREYLRHSPFADRCGLWLESPLLTLEPVERFDYQHLEYAPLVNPRAHQVGAARTILNTPFREQVQRAMKVLSYKPRLDAVDSLAVAYYMALQDRVSEAIAWFGRVDRKAVPEQLQCDYLEAYLAFYTGDMAVARKLAKAHAEEGVDRWRDRFALVLAQLDEIGGGAANLADRENRDQAQGVLAASEPVLEMQVEAGSVRLDTRNVTACTLNFYPMDIELLYSRSPFMQEGATQFSFIRPVVSRTLALPAGQNGMKVDLPPEFKAKNVMVEALAAGVRKTQAYYANTLKVQMIESYGQLAVTQAESGRPVPGTYVKVYARLAGGEVKFLKDGYTDLRGRFDYASLNTHEVDAAERLSVLVLSDVYGAVVREAPPPKR